MGAVCTGWKRQMVDLSNKGFSFERVHPVEGERRLFRSLLLWAEFDVAHALLGVSPAASMPEIFSVFLPLPSVFFSLPFPRLLTVSGSFPLSFCTLRTYTELCSDC